MKDSIIDLAVPFFLLLILAEAAYGKWKGKKVYRWNDTISDLSTGILFSLTGIFVTLGSLWLYEQARIHFSVQTIFGFSEIPSGSPITKGAAGWEFHTGETISWLLVLIAVDFVYYWFHRSTHDVHFLWACHVTHHSSEEFNLSVALRQNSFQRVFEYAFNLPLAIAGVPWWMFLLCHGILKIYQFWVHTRLIGKLGWMEKILLTPSHHRVHHGRDPEYLDKNHGGILILWDKWFGTFAEETKEPVYGLTTPLGTFEPVYANVHVYKNLWKLVSSVPKWKDKLSILFRKPDWRPDSMGGTIRIPKVDAKTYNKYDPQISSGKLSTGVVQFLLLSTISLALLKFFKSGRIDAEVFSIWAIWLILSFFATGRLLDGSKTSKFWIILSWALVLLPICFLLI
ncbi:sterol desaturase [Leptospira perolatii]|uniref:Sterol desaturase n=1 Tax=Leptospira perolatii TaxID=2023191 RepID=A0A2M9ZMI4_9LEPT|nr:sterol desaturase family protein [Leptospira perolatii]PJZ68512.1 sterol desaturase [Leptospira perolatii]PJZ73209.1 sterol desaturase [Leptospira perolatii]